MANFVTSNAVAAAGVKAQTDLADGGKLAVYDGTQPAGPGTAVTTQNKLVEFTLKSPAFGAPTAGTNKQTVTLDNPAAVAAALNGTASWFRIVDSSGVALYDGDVTDSSGNGNLKIGSTNVVQGIDVNIVSLTMSQPQK